MRARREFTGNSFKQLITASPSFLSLTCGASFGEMTRLKAVEMNARKRLKPFQMAVQGVLVRNWLGTEYKFHSRSVGS